MEDNSEKATYEKRRRNVLVVASSLLVAASIKLQTPLLTAEFSKFNATPETAPRLWIFAAVLVFYALMRFHFCAHMRRETAAANAECVQWITGALQGRLLRNAKQTVEGDGRLNNPGSTFYVREKDIIITNPRIDFFPARITYEWSLTPKVQERLPRGVDIDREYGALALPGSVGYLMHVFATAKRMVWSNGVWELNAVYIVALASIYACLCRASVLLETVPNCCALFH